MDEAIYHTALVYAGILKPGSITCEEKAKTLLRDYGSFKDAMLVQGTLEDIASKQLDKQIKKIQDTDFSMITYEDERFPEGLKFKGGPAVLYYQGDLSLLERTSMAVVGTREPTKYDLKLGEEVVKRLVYKGHVILSGLAKGCDTLGHEVAIANKGKTIAVLGTPIDRYYPAENRKLQELIAKEGLIVSQYPIGAKVQPYFFSNRNKSQVGLATEGVVVIKTGDKGGTQHTIKECLKQGKQLYALDGNFTNGINWAREKRDQLKIIKAKEVKK